MKFAEYLTPTAEIRELLATKDLFIFDLDGTLFNTLGDLAPAVNYAMRQYGLQEHSNEAVRTFIGNGSMNLIRRAVAASLKSAGKMETNANCAAIIDKASASDVDIEALARAGFDDAKIAEVHKVYSAYYWDHCTENTEPYEGVIELIKRITACPRQDGAGKKRAAMLTNKPVKPAKKILAKFGLIGSVEENSDVDGNSTVDGNCTGNGNSADNLISAYLCGDTTPERKPSPAGIFKIAADLGVSLEKAVMIGDDMPDVMAAKNAGVDCITLMEGFGKPENLLPLQPKWIARHIKDFEKAFRA